MKSQHAKPWFALIALVALSSCQSADSISASAPKEDSSQASEIVPPPKSTTKTDLAIFKDVGRVHVGDTWDLALEVFRPVRGAFEFVDLPPHFTPPNYKAKGWDSRREGFGVLLHEGRIASAMYQVPKGDLDQLNDIVALHRRELRPLVPSHIEGRHVQYWIWSQESQRLVIVGLQAQNTVKITVALGDNVVMDALGFSERDANRDLKRVDDLFESGLKSIKNGK